MCSALADRFLNTVPPGKSLEIFLFSVVIKFYELKFFFFFKLEPGDNLHSDFFDIQSDRQYSSQSTLT